MKRNVLLHSLMILGVIAIATVGCSKKSVSPSTTAPVLTTTTVTSVTETTAASGGSITSNGGAAVIVSGICWGLYANPTIADSITIDGAVTGSYSGAITGLKGNTLYYVRSYATNSAGTGYGDQKSFTTQQPVIPVFELSSVTVTLQGGDSGVEFFAKCINDNIKMTKVDIMDPIHPATITYNFVGQSFVKDQMFALQDAGIAYPKTAGTWRFDLYGNRTSTGKSFHTIVMLTVSK